MRLHQILVNGSGQWSALGPGFIRFKTEHGHVLRRRGDGFSIPLVGIGDEVRSEMFLQAERTIADIATKTGMKDYNRMYLDMFFFNFIKYLYFLTTWWTAMWAFRMQVLVKALPH